MIWAEGLMAEAFISAVVNIYCVHLIFSYLPKCSLRPICSPLFLALIMVRCVSDSTFSIALTVELEINNIVTLSRMQQQIVR